MENGVVNICNWLDRTRFTPMVCCLKDVGPMADRLKPDVKIVNLNFKDGKAPLRPFEMCNFFRCEQPDILHTHGWGSGLFEGVIGARLAGIPKIVNGEHGSFFLSSSQIFFQKLLFRMCDRLLSVSYSLRDKTCDHFKVDPAKIEVIHNGVDTDIFHGQYNKNKVYEQINTSGFVIHTDDFVIGMVGSLRTVKNNIMLLKAVKSLKEQSLIPDLKIIFIGDGPDRDHLKEYCRVNNLDEIVCLLGQRENVHELYSIMGTLVLCSLSEGMSNVLIEAMASGVPVICSDGSDVKREIVKDSYNGIVVENNDSIALSKAIIRMADKKIRSELGKNASDYISKEYSIVEMVKKYENFYLALHNKHD
jgi:glycosyltransferase involved in cell wall biosynthesis